MVDNSTSSVIISGGTQGLGMAVAKTLIAQGCTRLTITGRDADKGEAAAGQLGKGGVRRWRAGGAAPPKARQREGGCMGGAIEGDRLGGPAPCHCHYLLVELPRRLRYVPHLVGDERAMRRCMLISSCNMLTGLLTVGQNEVTLTTCYSFCR